MDVNKNLLDGRFQDTGWIDMYQSTSDTKLAQRPTPDKRKTDRFRSYGFYVSGTHYRGQLRGKDRVVLLETHQRKRAVSRLPFGICICRSLLLWH